MIMKLTKTLMSIVLLCISLPIMAQVTPKQEKEAIKEAKKEAKKLTKEGWVVAAGELSIEKQLANSFMMRMEKDDEGQAKYAFGRAISSGDFYDAAKLQAMEAAKSDLIGNMTTDITRLVDMKLQNQQKSTKSATSLSQVSAKSKSIMSQQLSNILPVVEIYRTNADGMVEVQLMLSYELQVGVNKVMDSINEDIEDEGIR